MKQTNPSITDAAPVTRTLEQRLMVAVRIRPLKNNEGQRVLHLLERKVVVLEEAEADKNDVLRQKRGGERKYVYDVTFAEQSSQEEVYLATTRQLVEDVLLGYNGTVFAYGATGSGKTHTMVGSADDPGIMVRALNDLFQHVRDARDPDEYKVTMSYLEIYNENIRDLLNPGSGFLELREDPRGRSMQVAGLTEVSTTSTDEVMLLLQKGNRRRTVEPTAANATSSRSHALLSVTVRHAMQLPGPQSLRTRVRQGSLFMIDLAGSERASQTKNRGKRLQEGAHINRSLLALGNCINALAGGARYVNYRDSKLTRLLKDALSGNCRTVMVAHVSPGARQREETRNTLLYAARAKNISNKVQSNVLDVSYHVSQYHTIINELQEEIARLKAKMAEDRPRSGDSSGAHRGQRLKHLREQLVQTFKEQMRLRRRLMELDGHLLTLATEAERQHMLISQYESRNNRLYNSSHMPGGRMGPPRRPHTDSRGTNGRTPSGTDVDTDRELSDGESTETALQQAYVELAYIQREQERYAEMRAETEKNLEECRKQALRLEDELPVQMTSEEERELLALMCRVHELEVEKMALQSERIVRQHELRRRDMALLRFDRQQQLCEEIITRQRQLMEEGCVSLPPDLQELYTLYQRELHAASYNETSPSYLPGYPFSNYVRDKDKLPPISHSEPLFHRSMRFSREPPRQASQTDSEMSLRTPSSSAGSDYDSPLPPIHESHHNRPGQLETNPAAAVLFPPIALPPSNRDMPRSSQTTGRVPRSETPSRILRQRRYSGRGIRKVVSDEDLTTEKVPLQNQQGAIWRY